MIYKKKRHDGARERGQSIVEFTLVMPLLFLVLTGAFSFGFTLHDYLVLTNAVDTGAQLLAISRGQTSDPCATTYSAIQNAAPGLISANLVFSVVINGTSYSVKSCPAGAANMVQGASTQVTVTYPCSLPIYGMSFPGCSLKTQLTELIQ